MKKRYEQYISFFLATVKLYPIYIYIGQLNIIIPIPHIIIHLNYLFVGNYLSYFFDLFRQAYHLYLMVIYKHIINILKLPIVAIILEYCSSLT